MERVVAPRVTAWKVEVGEMGCFIGLGLRTAAGEIQVALPADVAADLTRDLMLALREIAGNLAPGDAEAVH